MTTPMDDREQVDVVIVGAGFSGLYLVRRLRDLGYSTRVFEAGSDVGGTWYWNRYPGARSDTDSTVYCFSDRFDAELLAEWQWSERYPAQPEIQRYLQWVADRRNLRDTVVFNTMVRSARYDDSLKRWLIETDAGHAVSAQFFIPAVGLLSKPNIPRFEGLEKFEGTWFHTARPPEGDTNYAGKRVAVIGNGATAVQVVPVVAQEAEQVIEFTRNPYHLIPGRNHRLDEDDWAEIHAHHDEIWAQARGNFAGFPYADPPGAGPDFTPEQQHQILDEAWRTGGFPFLLATFADVVTSRDTNELYLDFMRERIRRLVHDPAVAELVTPTQPFMTKRPPVEHGYYSALNRPNVALVDLKSEPIHQITRSGIVTSAQTYDVDVIIFATGFDAFTGAVLDIDIAGRDGLTLQQKWATGVSTYLGLAYHGFPNLFTLYCGPFVPAYANAPVLIEQQAEWILDCLAHMSKVDAVAIEATAHAEAVYKRTHDEIADMTLIPETESWWTGTNVEGKQRTVLPWCGGFQTYRAVCDQAASDYVGFDFSTMEEVVDATR